MAVPATDRNGTSHDTEALYREHGAAVAALCGSLLRDRGETEDATQQVFLSAHRALLNGATPREPRAWLLTVARNECYARFRQRAATPLPAGDTPETATPDAAVQVLRAGELANMWDEVERMPPRQREAFILREIRGLSYGQLADELSLSRPSVRSLLLRARTRLRRRLGDVAAGLGGAPWVQALLRLVAGGDGASPLPGATKAAAVGVGALALAGGGGLVAHHASTTPRHRAEHNRAAVRVHHGAAAVVAPVEDRSRFVDRSFAVDRSRGRDGGSRESGERSRSSGDSSSGSGRDGSDDTTTAAAIAESSTDGHGGSDGGSSSRPGSSGSGRDSSSSSSGHEGSGGESGTSGSTSGSDDGSDSITTASSSDSGSGSSGSDGGGSGGSDGGGGHDGGDG